MNETGFPERTEVGTVSAVPGSRSTTELLHAALAGDGKAWGELVEEYTDLLWWVARSYRLDDATAADVVQTVWLQLVQHGASIRDPERLPGWLATTARREAQRRIGVARRQVPVEDVGDQPADDRMGPDEHVLDEELIGAALAAFDGLGESCKQLLAYLCEVPPKSYTEISALLNIPVGSIGPTRQRCLANLRAEMRGMGFS